VTFDPDDAAAETIASAVFATFASEDSSTDGSKVTGVPDAAPRASWYGAFARPSGAFGAYVAVHGAPTAPIRVGTDVAVTVVASFEPPEGTFDWAVVSKLGGVFASGTVARDGSLSFRTTAAMRGATLVAYAVATGTSGSSDEPENVIACSTKLSVDSSSSEGLPQNVSISLSTRETIPGGTVRLTVTTTAPNSRVFVLAHDTSVILQSGGKQSALSASRILAATAAAGGVGDQDPPVPPFDSSASMDVPSCYPPADIDVSELVFLTPARTSSCAPSAAAAMFDSAVAGVPEMAFAAKSEEAFDQESASSQESPSETLDTVRTFFPETWVWESLDSDPATGVARFSDLTAPDTITSWRFRAFAAHPSYGIGAGWPTTRRRRRW
jgi:hypothetical protein